MQFETNTYCNLRQIHFAIWDKYKFEKDTFCVLRFFVAPWQKYIMQVYKKYLLRWEKYILQFETNTFSNLKQLNFKIWEKYILQFEKNIFCNLGRIHFAIWNIYIFYNLR